MTQITESRPLSETASQEASDEGPLLDISIRPSALRAFVCVVAIAVLSFPFGAFFFTFPDSPAPVWITNLYRRTNAILAVEDDSPKTLIVGGSGALFGIRAELLEAAIGQRTVNCATHYGLSPDLIMQRCRRHLNPGDRVILVMEYNAFEFASNEPLHDVAWQYTACFDPALLWEWGPRRAAFAVATANPSPKYSTKQRLTGVSPLSLDQSTYPVGNLSQWGDSMWLPPSRTVIKQAPLPPRADALAPEWARPFRELMDWAANNDVEVALLPPAVHRPPVDQTADFDHLHQALESLADQHGAVLLGQPADFYYDTWQFSDTYYHLTPSAALINTWRVAHALEEQGWASLPNQVGRVLLGPASTTPRWQREALASGKRPVFEAHENISEPTLGDATDDPAVLLRILDAGYRVRSVWPEHLPLKPLPPDMIVIGASRHMNATSDVSSLLPDELRPLASAGYHTAIVGTGKHALIQHQSSSGSDPVENIFQATLKTRNNEPLIHKFFATSDATQFNAIVNHAVFNHRSSRAGLFVGVFDPDLGVLIDTINLTAAGRPTRPDHWVIQGEGAGLKRQQLPLTQIVATGVTPPKIVSNPGSTSVEFTGERSFAAVQIPTTTLGPGWHWVIFTIQGIDNAPIDACTWTNGVGNLSASPESIRCRIGPGPTRIVVPIDLSAGDHTPVLAGVCSDRVGQIITIEDVQLISPNVPSDAGEF